MFVGYQTQSNYSYCSYNYHKPKREIVVIWPNLAIGRGPHIVRLSQLMRFRMGVEVPVDGFMASWCHLLEGATWVDMMHVSRNQ